MSFDELALICTYSAINMLSQVKSGLSFFWIFLMRNEYEIVLLYIFIYNVTTM